MSLASVTPAAGLPKLTLEPTADLIQRRAQRAGREVALTSRLCAGAFDARPGDSIEAHGWHEKACEQSVNKLVFHVNQTLF